MTTDTGAAASFSAAGKSLEFPLVAATEGNSGYDISTLLKETGNVTLDYGFGNTASCSSAITYIDGDAGILRYRGYPIEQLARKSTYLETAYLLIYGELPNKLELEDFQERVCEHTMLHEELKMFFDGFPRDAHPMPVLSSAVSALSTFYQDSLDPFDPMHVEISTVRLLAKLPTIAAYAYKKSIGQPLLYPDNSLTLTENFLRMTFGVPAVDYEIDPVMVKALELLLILHADHEQNCSTSTVRLVGSSHANLFASVSAGINALFGPLHGGANQAVLEMLNTIHAEGGDIDRFITRVKNKEPGVKLMGFGHRVYKNYDPRAAIVKEMADTILRRSGAVDPLLDIALQLEQRALHDDYFAERKLYPNVDFYTGLIYKAMGFPTRMFTVLFALGRLPGWIAQWREMMSDPTTKIGRPRQVYVGELEREYVSVKKRSGLGGKEAKEAKALEKAAKAAKAADEAAKAAEKALKAERAAEKAAHKALEAAEEAPEDVEQASTTGPATEGSARGNGSAADATGAEHAEQPAEEPAHQH